MVSATSVQDALDPHAAEVYERALRALDDGGVRHLVGGALAYARYTGIVRDTKDMDLFVLPEDVGRALEVLDAAGFRTELTYPHWLAKAHHGHFFVDLIFSADNGVARVDEEWFEHAVTARLLDRDVLLCPPEEMVWSKSYVMERERYDGADIAHLVRSCGTRLDWHRLLLRFGADWPVLLSHVVLFRYSYPDAVDAIPEWLMRELVWRLEQGMTGRPNGDRVCHGRLLSRAQYLVDVEEMGYRDPLADMVPLDLNTAPNKPDEEAE